MSPAVRGQGRAGGVHAAAVPLALTIRGPERHHPGATAMLAALASSEPHTAAHCQHEPRAPGGPEAGSQPALKPVVTEAGTGSLPPITHTLLPSPAMWEQSLRLGAAPAQQGTPRGIPARPRPCSWWKPLPQLPGAFSWTEMGAGRLPRDLPSQKRTFNCPQPL